MASQGTRGLLGEGEEEDKDSLETTYMMEGFLKARGCISLRASPLSQ